MRLYRLAQIFENKYNLQSDAAGSRDPFDLPIKPVPSRTIEPSVTKKPSILPSVTFPTPNMKDIEASIRNQIDNLWIITNKTHNILKICADAGVSKPQNASELKALQGFQFCREVVSIIDYLKANKSDLSLSKIREALEELKILIVKNRQFEAEDKQFPHVSELIFYVVPGTKKYELKIRAQQYAKARTGLSLILSKAETILDEMNRLGGAPKETSERFKPQSAELAQSEIDLFIRLYGDSFYLTNLEMFRFIENYDPKLKLALKNLVRSFLRGRPSHDADKIKPIIKNILVEHLASKRTNAPYFERQQPSQLPVSLLESSEEAETPVTEQQLKTRIQPELDEDRTKHIRSDGTSLLLDQLLKGTL